MIWKISALAKFEIWGVFANTLTLDDNYPVPILQTLKDLVRPLSKKSRVRTCFDSQYVKGSQTLVKTPRDQFYRIFSSLWGEIIWKVSALDKFEKS